MKLFEQKPSSSSCASWPALEQYAGGQLALGIERPFDGAHLLNGRIAIELLQQLLLDRIPPDAVLGERAAAEARAFAAEVEQRVLAGDDVIVRAGQHVGMDVAVGNVPPDREVETAAAEALAI